MPGGEPGAAAGELGAAGVDESEVDGGDGAAPVQVAEGVELLQEDVGDACLVVELADGGLVHGLGRGEEAAGEGPVALGGLGAAADEEDVEAARVHGEDDHEDGNVAVGCLALHGGGGHVGTR